MGVYFIRISAMMLLCLGLKCWMMTNAMLVAGDTLEKSTSSASRPPADEPIPTTGKWFRGFETPSDFFVFSPYRAFWLILILFYFFGEQPFLFLYS
jgi:hypothetical protein